MEFVEFQAHTPHRIAEVRYSVVPQASIPSMSVLPCRRTAVIRSFGVNDGRLGVCEKNQTCLTCGLKFHECVGHPGHINLELPVFHLGFFTAVLRVARTICKKCGCVLLNDEEKEYYQRKFRGKLDPLQRASIARLIQTEAYKTRVCFRCSGLNGVVRRVRPLRIVHEKFNTSLRRNEESDDTAENYWALFESAQKLNPEMEAAKANAHDFLDPLRLRDLFRRIPAEEVVLLGFDPGTRPEDLILSSMLVPPVCVRPSGLQQLCLGGPMTSGSREDDLTLQYNDILTASEILKDGSIETAKLVENWDLLQLRAARLLDGSLPGFAPALKGIPTKSYAQRMKGKHGRFRGNLSGKRVDFSGRSVISPDPNLEIDEIALPLRIAKALTYPQRVNKTNLSLMRKLVKNGPDCHPGAIYVTFAKGGRKNLFYDRETIAAQLSIGDTVERHVMSGDLLIFNRQPSLHRISMMCHRARVLPFRTLRFNECCCAPYNADFDGDEMNIHLVQTEEARAEALSLMLTANNIISAKNGEPIIACTQDFLTCSFLVTSCDTFFDRSQFCQAVSHWLGTEDFDLPTPAILLPCELWTGKQLFDVIIRPKVHVKYSLNFEAMNRSYTKGRRQECPEEGFVMFNNNSLLLGRLDKKILGGGAKDGLFARLHSVAGGPYAAKCMGRIAKFTSRHLMLQGFSLGLGDVFPTASLEAKKAQVLERSFAHCADLIQQADSGQLQPLPGLSVPQTLEAHLNAELSTVRELCGSEAVGVLTSTNAPLVMALSGSKGSNLNIAQMMACVGQQTVSGKRIQNAFVDRSLPHFPRFAQHPAARGFVANSFYSGLTPTEFYFHTMAGREGLVDTAVKTAETGYIYRRLMKAMEDLSIKYDYTVRNSKNDIVQLQFGEDMLDPQLMEGSGCAPLNLSTVWLGIVNTDKNKDAQLSHEQATKILCEELESSKFARCNEKFRKEIAKFIWDKTEAVKNLRSVDRNDANDVREKWLRDIIPLTESVLRRFLDFCAARFVQKMCEPGTPCGAIAAQSVGEPSTQMTLRTFHFAGVASMNITQGVPRLVEIINANKQVSTPVIRAPLNKSDNTLFAVHVKASIERVTLKEVMLEICEVLSQGAAFLRLFLNRRLINDLQLGIDSQTVKWKILMEAKKPLSTIRQLKPTHICCRNKDVLDLFPFESGKNEILFNIKNLVALLPEIVVGGIPQVKRAIISKKKDSDGKLHCEIVAEGAELRSVMILAGVDGEHTVCNHVGAVEQVLGIEAARATIVSEILNIIQAYSLSIDIRHIYLLADVMTHRGVVLGITRYGIQKMNNGVLTMASFERTTEHLYDAAVFNRRDSQLSVSENIIVGAPIPLGTNSFQLLHTPCVEQLHRGFTPLVVSGSYCLQHQ